MALERREGDGGDDGYAGSGQSLGGAEFDLRIAVGPRPGTAAQEVLGQIHVERLNGEELFFFFFENFCP